MKKKTSIVLLLVAVMMISCGKTNETTVDTDANKPVEVVSSVKDPITTPEASEPFSTPEPDVPTIPVVSDKIDRIVDVDIPVGSQSEKVELPELHLYVTGDLVEQVSSGTTKYEIPNAAILLRVSARYFQDPELCEPCWESYMAPHYETADYGRYIVDIDSHKNNDSEIEFFYETTNITVYNTQLCGGVTITIALNITNETAPAPTDAELKYIKQYGLMEAEYIKEQVSAWPQDFVPENGTDVGTVAPVDVASGEIPYGWYICADINKYMQINVEDGEFNVIMFGDSSTNGVDYMYDIVWVEGNTYSIELGEKYGIATLTDGSIQVTADKDELKVYEGSYVVQ